MLVSSQGSGSCVNCGSDAAIDSGAGTVWGVAAAITGFVVATGAIGVGTAIAEYEYGSQNKPFTKFTNTRLTTAHEDNLNCQGQD
jgi:hypothetical protein